MLHNLRARPVPALTRRFSGCGCVAVAIIAWLGAAQAGAAPAPFRTAVIEGSTVYSQADFFVSYRDQLGRPADRDSARAVAAAIAARYLADGYARPEFRLDESLIADGVLKISIFEPRITRVTIAGSTGRYRQRLELIAGRVRDSQPLRRDAVPQALAAMRQLPGLSITATTRPDAAGRNLHELVVQAEFRSVGGMVRSNNRGTDQVGNVFVLGQVEVNDLLGRGEEIGLVFAATTNTSEYLSGAAYLDAPLGDSGTRAMAMVFHSDSSPNESPVNLSDEYTRDWLTLRLSRPLAQPAGRSVTLNGAFEAENLRVDRDGVDVRKDRLRVIQAGLQTGWRAFESTQMFASLELRQGLDVLGAGLRADDLEVDPRDSEFLLAQLQVTSYTPLAERWSVRVDLFAQQSGDVLPDSERFKIGGERLGRGFEVAEIAGDQGLGGKLLVRRELAATATRIGRPSAYGFYDIGAVWKQDLPGRESASTLGFGLALAGSRFSGYLEAAKPLTHGDVEGDRSTSLFAEISLRF